MINFEQPSVKFIEKMGDDRSVVNAARVSFDKEISEFTDRDEKLIKYLAVHKHWSPFAHTTVKLRIANPIFLARQLVKHQVGGVWNEESRRYISDVVKYYMPESFRKKPDGSIKQGSGEVFDDSDYKDICSIVASIYDVCDAAYRELLDKGVCPEQARMVLPLGSMTHWVWSGSLYFWARVYHLRSDSHAQRDLRIFVEQLDEIMSEHFPVSWKYLKENPPT